jgi:hypothetical protein
MKKLYLFAILILFFSCKTNQLKFQEITLSKKTVIGISPDSIEIKKMKEKWGEEDFYTAADDIMWYNGQMLKVIDSLKIDYIHTDKKYIRIITPNKKIEINTDTTKIKWRYFYFNGKEILEKDVFDIINMYEFYK